MKPEPMQNIVGGRSFWRVGLDANQGLTTLSGLSWCLPGRDGHASVSFLKGKHSLWPPCPVPPLKQSPSSLTKKLETEVGSISLRARNRDGNKSGDGSLELQKEMAIKVGGKMFQVLSLHIWKPLPHQY